MSDIPNPSSNWSWTATILGDSNYPLPSAMANTTTLELIADISSSYYSGVWSFTALGYVSDLIDKHILSVSTKIQFEFTSSADNYKRTLVLSILSFSIPTSDSNIYVGNQISIALITPWYFDQMAYSKAYSNTSTGIIRQIATEEFIGNNYYKFNLNMPEDSADPITTRFRTFQTPVQFIRERVFPYSRGKSDSMMFMFTDSNQTLNIMSMNYLLTQKVVTLIDSRHPKPPTSLLDSDKTLIYNTNHMGFGINMSKKQALWDLVKPSLMYLQSPSFTTKLTSEGYMLYPLSNNYDNVFTFVSSKGAGVYPLKYYLDDSLRTSDDIFSYNVRKYTQDLMDEHSFIASGSLNFFLEPGKLIKPYWSNENTGNPSTLNQTYMVSRISHIFNGGVGYTTLVGNTPSYSASDLTKVSELFTRTAT